ncbi:pseudouridine synthase [Nigerium massiliense]|uniref:pseudouridine synthase n=1 Tax=Nigerium massiliense TaxID=1522317 RepID=UPI0036F1C486
MRAYLRERLAEGAPVDAMLAAGEIVDGRGRPVAPAEAYRPHTVLWFHRELPPEPPVPGRLEVLYRDERIVVVDKPAFLSSTPRGGHIRESAVVRLRVELGLPELTAAHRLDRLTAGVLLLTTARRWRAPYQQLFATRGVHKTYEALAPRLEGPFPRTVANHLAKPRGSLIAVAVPGRAPNAVTRVEVAEGRGGLARYRLTPLTGKTHQLRAHLSGLGAPILNDPLYPVPGEDADDFSRPLALIARELAFTDPVDGTRRAFRSGASLPWPPAPSRNRGCRG